MFRPLEPPRRALGQRAQQEWRERVPGVQKVEVRCIRQLALEGGKAAWSGTGEGAGRDSDRL